MSLICISIVAFFARYRALFVNENMMADLHVPCVKVPKRGKIQVIYNYKKNINGFSIAMFERKKNIYKIRRVCILQIFFKMKLIYDILAGI